MIRLEIVVVSVVLLQSAQQQFQTTGVIDEAAVVEWLVEQDWLATWQGEMLLAGIG